MTNNQDWPKQRAEIEARVEAATGGDWIENGTLVLATHEEADASSNDGEDWVTFNTHNNHADRQLWLTAKRDLRTLLARSREDEREIARLCKKVDMLTSLCAGLGDTIAGRTKPFEQIKRELKKK